MSRTHAVLFCILSSFALCGQVKLPPFTRQELPNGVVVDLMPRRGVPLVQFQVVIKGGNESDPSNLPGLSSLTADLLRKGTAKRSADKFSQELDFLGGTFGTFSPAQSSAIEVSAEFLSKDLDRGLDLVSDALLHPSFPEAEVRKLVAQRTDSAKALKDSPGAIFSYFESFYFGPNHPYGRIPDETTYSRIQRQDIVDYHARMFCGKNIVLIVAGDFDPASTGIKIREAFGSVPAGKEYQWTSAARGPNTGPKLLLVDKPDATQTYFYIGQPGIDRKSQDRVKLMLVNTLFGGRFTSMLNDALRVNSGLTYGASSRLQQPRLTGAVFIDTYTKTETTAQAIDMSLDILKKIGQQGITAEQLASVKAYTKGMFPTQRLETNDQLATILGEMELYGLNRGEIDDFFSAVDAVTLADANAVAKKYYKSENLTFVLLGNAAKIREVAAKYAAKMTEVPIIKAGFAPAVAP